SKMKFKIYSDSYPIDDVHLSNQRDAQTVDAAVKVLRSDQVPSFMFIHFSNPDYTGHHEGLSVEPESSYLKTVFGLDDYLGEIMGAIMALNRAGHSTVLIVTADHGGTGKDHGNSKDRLDYTIPFIVWGDQVAHGKDLYVLNKRTRQNPGTRQIPYDKPKQ